MERTACPSSKGEEPASPFQPCVPLACKLWARGQLDREGPLTSQTSDLKKWDAKKLLVIYERNQIKYNSSDSWDSFLEVPLLLVRICWFKSKPSLEAVCPFSCLWRRRARAERGIEIRREIGRRLPIRVSRRIKSRKLTNPCGSFQTWRPFSIQSSVLKNFLQSVPAPRGDRLQKIHQP